MMQRDQGHRTRAEHELNETGCSTEFTGVTNETLTFFQLGLTGSLVVVLVLHPY